MRSLVAVVVSVLAVPATARATAEAAGAATGSAAPVATAGVPFHGSVVDETALVLPGATVELVRGGQVVAATVTDGQGSFALPAPEAGDLIRISLQGFETAIVASEASAHVVLQIAGTSAVTSVTAEEAAPATAGAPDIGVEITRQTLIDMPEQGPYVRDNLTLLPSVVRGQDGVPRFAGARPRESAVRLDGFDVSDPATGLSHLDLPAESVAEAQVLDDPADVTLGGFLGGVATMGARSGGSRREAGVEGFLPKPRLTGGGTFKRIDGFSPRAYVGGEGGGGRLHYFTSGEVDYERSAVPDVTRGSGLPDTGTTAATIFARVDATVSPRNNLTSETVVFPYRVVRAGLSPLVDEGAAPDLADRDVFEGVTDRQLLGAASALTVRAGFLTHRGEVEPAGGGVALATPLGWRQASPLELVRTASRATLEALWQHAFREDSGDASRARDDLTLFAAAGERRLDGEVSETPVHVLDADGRVVRTVSFAVPDSDLRARDGSGAVGARDVVSVGRATVDLGARLDREAHGGTAASARVGVDLGLDRDRVTVLKASAGRFIGTVPLDVPAYVGFPVREDTDLDPETGAVRSRAVLVPRLGELRLPRATSASVHLERRLFPRVLGVASLAARSAQQLTTLEVRPEQGALLVASNGTARYAAASLALQAGWGSGGKLFASWVHASDRGSASDFGTLVSAGDAPLLEPVPDGEFRTPSDAPDRGLLWGTLDLPRGWVLGPQLEWHSGFPWTPLDARQHLADEPASRSFPAYFSVDFTVQKWLTFHRHRALVGVGILNVTGHDNPRDVYAAEGSDRTGTFTNSPGRWLQGAYTLRF